MQRIDGRIIFSPHDLINFMQCEFITWMDRRYLDDRSLVPDEDDANTKLLQAKGIDHEVAYLEKQRLDGKSIASIADGDKRFEQTIQALRDGYDLVYQAALSDGTFAGIADFLCKRDGTSALGNYFYDVFDTKLAKTCKPEFIIQLCCYADLLHTLQGRLPEKIAVALGSGVEEQLRTSDYFFYYRSLKHAFLKFIASFDASVPPDDIRVMPFSRWNTEAARILEERDDLSQIANIRRVQVSRLQDAGISSMESLADSDFLFVPKMGPETFSALKQQAKLQIASRGLSRPRYELISCSAHERRGLLLLPPADPSDIWFDMEGYPYAEGGLEYLFGATYVSDGQCIFKDFWGHSREAEKQAFEAFIDWVFSRWQENPAMHIYHYANYEVSALRRLMGIHGTREEQVDTLLRNEIFVDLYQIVRHSLRVGEPSYSIKNIEHLYRGKRGGDVATAVDSIVQYDKWLCTADGDTWQTSKLLSDIRDYNRMDCESIMELTDWLRQRQSEANIAFRPKPTKPGDDIVEDALPKTSTAQRNSDLAAQILHEVETGKYGDGTDRRIASLLAHLLQFHERERKPFWWSLFERLAMTQHELIVDAECLGGLARTQKAVEQVATKRANWNHIEYEFDCTQETKLAAGAKCCLSYDFSIKTEIVRLDLDHGKVTIKLRSEQPLPQTPFGLIPCELIPQKALQDAIFEIVSSWRAGNGLPKSLSDFLHRLPPHLQRKQFDGTVLEPRSVAETLLDMQQSSLCIQGPPGSGKTTLAANVISDLLARGLRVGITSNSHKSIEHLINKCAQVATARGITVTGAKIGGDGQEPPQLHSTVKLFQEKLRVFPPDDFNLIGGTSFAFCIEPAIDAFDYLFVDEAGQMCLANLVAMARSARNLIFLGDQMQLEQPVQGQHPGESGLSVLDYFMQGEPTIRADRGVFLGVTHRMHPEICATVSEAVYEGRLHASERTRQRELILPGACRYVQKRAGIQFVPVEHDGNSQSSVEEAECIRDLVAELQTARWLEDGQQSRPISLNDILIVAPFNSQVRQIREYLPNARVGTVDKFQGQEAAIVIISMAASDAAAAPRGINFLFNRSRLNVALSRAMTLSVVVASPRLQYVCCNTKESMTLCNLFSRIVQEGSGLSIQQDSDRSIIVP